MLIEAEPISISAAAWDTFAQSCGASFRCAHRATRAWQLEHHLWFRVLRFDLILVATQTRQKIGQCAVGVGRNMSVFADGIQLLPGYNQFWSQAMQAVLAEVGPGKFHYGSEWSLEPCRLEMLNRLNSVQVTRVRSIDVQAVDFNQWPNWDDYFQAVSPNIRRNVKKAHRSYPDIRYVERRKTGVYWDFLALQISRYCLFRRKGVRRSFQSIVLRSLFRLLFTNKYAISARCDTETCTLAHYSGIDFGQDSFFLEASARPNSQGASWFLLMAVMARAHQRSKGQGRFVMGPDEQLDRGDPAWEGLVRSRQQCRVVSHPTSVITFIYGSDDLGQKPLELNLMT